MTRLRGLVTCSLLLLVVAGGCSENWQQKFIRKKKAPGRLSPVITFEDYTKTTTPIDRYRKHYMLFQYWNGELLDALAPTGTNIRRAKKASAQALDELRTIAGLVQDGQAPQAQAMIDERARIDRQLQSERYAPAQLEMIRQTLDRQTRQVHRELAWQKVEEHLKESPSP